VLSKRQGNFNHEFGVMVQVQPFILCGGSGTRLWPLSRESFPKQFHKIVGDGTLFQQACRRVAEGLAVKPIVLSGHKHRFLVAEQLEDIGLDGASIVIEPAARSTAPAACIAALVASERDADSVVLLAPADHVFADASAFTEAVEAAIAAAGEGMLVVFGAEPDCAHTGYGYIEVERSNFAALGVRRFVEKPSQEVAETYLESGDFLWNVGIFVCKASTLIELFETHAPDVLSACRAALAEATADMSFTVLGEAYARAPAISLDYAIAEKAANLRCVPLGTSWSDVGSWSALWSFLEKNEDGNVVQGHADIMLENVRNSYVYADHGCVALVGVENLIVVAMEDATLVASKEEAESIRKVVDRLKGNGHYQAMQHARVYRPWGWYQGLNQGERYQVKCIMVKPKAKLSLQSHHHRSEHWVVVTGPVEVTRGEHVELLSENQSTYIPIGEKHRLANPGKIPAFLIEVQSGPYLDEDDIVRYQDVYGRA
jgi:mannose-1-phosphate guanylyltransferase/mannose-6-phosphate isomerase